ncbi:MAG: UbiX family flavin prenyltransferase [Magnetovibrionaceae bacterium]
MSHPRLIIGITGASGIIYGLRALELCRELEVETHLILSKAGVLTLEYETDLKPDDVKALADVVHSHGDLGAACSSGSYQTLGMLVAPCSMKTLAEIASGVTSNLVSRSADVTLKERRRLVLLTRETPLTSIHIRNMADVTAAGGIIAPPVPAFYTKPDSLDDIIDHTVSRALDLFGLDTGRLKRWKDSE